MILGIPVRLYHLELEEEDDLLLRFTFRYRGKDYVVHRGWEEERAVLHCDRLRWSPWSGATVEDLGQYEDDIPKIALALWKRIRENPKDYPYAGEHYEVDEWRWTEDDELVIRRRQPRKFALRKPWIRIGNLTRCVTAALVAFFTCLWYGVLGGQDWAFPAFNTYPDDLRAVLLGICGAVLALIVCGIWGRFQNGRRVVLLGLFPLLLFHTVGIVRTGQEFAPLVNGLLAVGLLLCVIPQAVGVFLDERPLREGAKNIANALAMGLYLGCAGLMVISLILLATDLIAVLL